MMFFYFIYFDGAEAGNRLIRFSYEGIFNEILDQLGQVPLPPYITHKLEDRSRYSTVYEKYEGSAAAPTAGLHFTKELLQEIREMGVEIAEVTLHVGLGTFRPVKVDKVEEQHITLNFIPLRRIRQRLLTGPRQKAAVSLRWEPPAVVPWSLQQIEKVM